MHPSTLFIPGISDFNLIGTTLEISVFLKVAAMFTETVKIHLNFQSASLPQVIKHFNFESAVLERIV